MKPKMIAVNDDVTTCTCCGKTNLKKTVVLSFDGEIEYYGVNCAAKALRSSWKGCDGKMVSNLAAAVALAAKWIAAGYAPKEVAKGICLRFGYCAEFCKNTNVIRIADRAEVPAC